MIREVRQGGEGAAHGEYRCSSISKKLSCIRCAALVSGFEIRETLRL